MKNIKQAIFFYLLLPLFYILALCPFWLLYRLSDGFFYLAYYAINYRRKIVRKNLKQAFPKATKQALSRLEKDFYRQLCDLIFEHIKCISITAEELAKRFVVTNLAFWERYHALGKNMLIVGAHQGNWEWGSYAMSLATKYVIAGVYQPLSNTYFDCFMNKLRKKFGRQLIPQKKVLHNLLTYHGAPRVMGFLADQAPRSQQGYVVPFLNIPTAFDLGVAKLAHKLNQPLVYVQVTKLKRGYYQLEEKLISENPIHQTPLELIKAYVSHLEETIRSQPNVWLWSHNRWKETATTQGNS